jgi:hypothetical protein
VWTGALLAFGEALVRLLLLTRVLTDGPPTLTFPATASSWFQNRHSPLNFEDERTRSHATCCRHCAMLSRGYAVRPTWRRVQIAGNESVAWKEECYGQENASDRACLPTACYLWYPSVFTCTLALSAANFHCHFTYEYKFIIDFSVSLRIKSHQGRVLHPSCYPEKVGVNKKLYSRKKKVYISGNKPSKEF